MTADQLRRSIRRELHVARCRDGDHGEARLWEDARELDRRMTEAGHPPERPTTWGTSPTIIARRAAGKAAFRLLGGAGAGTDDPECQLEEWERV